MMTLLKSRLWSLLLAAVIVALVLLPLQIYKLQQEAKQRELAYGYAIYELLGTSRQCGKRDVEQWRPLIRVMLRYNTTQQSLQLPAYLQGQALQLIMGVVATESEGNPCAASLAGARGLMQLMPDTWQECGVSNPADPVQNLDCGIGFLRRLLVMYDGDITKALRAYNLGVGNYTKVKTGKMRMPLETVNYPSKVLQRMRDF
jgi:soluble lytic murein transglycosylase-like protein